MHIHQQRFPDEYRDALALPLGLHLAKLATEYALPHELAEGTGDQEGEKADGSQSEDGDSPGDD
jgi:RNaseH domain of pPIWI_RE